MILAIDIGNTNIVFGCIIDDDICFTARVSTDRRKTSDQYAAEIKIILELYKVDISSIRGSIISSVVPPVLNYVREAVRLITGIDPAVVGPGLKTGLNILMDNPAQVGSDRIVNAVAALSMYEPPIIIIDMGTATTLCAIDKYRNYIGGAIIPGINISVNALSANTAQLPSISLEEPKRVIGKNTIESMRSGIVLGTAAMLDGMIKRFEDELGQEAVKLATGGLSKFIIPHCEREIIYDENLLLKGLNILYYSATKKRNR